MLVALDLKTTQHLLMTLVLSLFQVGRRSTVPLARLLLYHYFLGCSTCSFLSSSISSRSSRQVSSPIHSPNNAISLDAPVHFQKRNYGFTSTKSVTQASSLFPKFP